MGDASTVDRLVAELHTGAPEEAGAFSIDAASAERKLRALRLDHPLHWVLVVLRGAVRAGATRVEVSERDGDLVMEWPEETALPAGDLLPTAALGSEGDAAGLREVLLGAFIGINHGLGEVEIASGSRMLVVDGGSIREREVRPTAGTRVVARGRLVAPLDGQRAELWVLRKRGRYLAIPLMVGRARASFGMDGDLDLDAQTIEVKPKHERFLRAGLVDADHGEVRLLADGVWLESITGDAFPPGFVAVLRRGHEVDAGQGSVIRDGEHNRAMDVARAVAKKQRKLDPPPSERLVARLERELESASEERELVGRAYVAGLVFGGLVVLLSLGFYFTRWTSTDGLLAALFMSVIAAGVAGFIGAGVVHTVDQARCEARARDERRSRFPPHHPGRRFVRRQLDARPMHARWKIIAVLTPGLVAGLYLPLLLGPGLEAKAAPVMAIPALIGAVLGLAFGSMFADIYTKRIHGGEDQRIELPPEPAL